MNEIKKVGFFEGLCDAIAGRTDLSKHRAEVKRQFERDGWMLPVPQGATSAIEEKQRALDALRMKTRSFMEDLTMHFGSGGKFLTEAYTSASVLSDESSTLDRRFAMKWKNDADFDTKTEISFAYTANSDEGIRVDYVMTHRTQLRRGPIEVVNDKFFTNGETHKELARAEDVFRAVRRYETHAKFCNAAEPPKWFFEQLEKYAIKAQKAG